MSVLKKIKNIIFNQKKYELSPKGISFLKYLENDVNGIKQEKIERYEETISKLTKVLNKPY